MKILGAVLGIVSFIPPANLLLLVPYMIWCGTLIADDEKRSDWRALLFFGAFITIPLFWLWYVRPYFWPDHDARATAV